MAHCLTLTPLAVYRRLGICMYLRVQRLQLSKQACHQQTRCTLVCVRSSLSKPHVSYFATAQGMQDDQNPHGIEQFSEAALSVTLSPATL